MMQTQAVKQESFVKTSWLVELLHQSVHLCEKLCPSEKIRTGTGGLRMCFDVENVIFFSFFSSGNQPFVMSQRSLMQPQSVFSPTALCGVEEAKCM